MGSSRIAGTSSYAEASSAAEVTASSSSSSSAKKTIPATAPAATAEEAFAASADRARRDTRKVTLMADAAKKKKKTSSKISNSKKSKPSSPSLSDGGGAMPTTTPNDNDDDDVPFIAAAVMGLRRGHARGGVCTPFPLKLHLMLDDVQERNEDGIVSWSVHGRSFAVRRPQEFVKEIMPRYFKQTKLTSFQRQLNLYGFNRLTAGSDKGSYYHELFLRGKPYLSSKMIRMRVKGTGCKGAANPKDEPDFYGMPPVRVDRADVEFSLALRRECAAQAQAQVEGGNDCGRHSGSCAGKSNNNNNDDKQAKRTRSRKKNNAPNNGNEHGGGGGLCRRSPNKQGESGGGDTESKKKKKMEEGGGSTNKKNEQHDDNEQFNNNNSSSNATTTASMGGVVSDLLKLSRQITKEGASGMSGSGIVVNCALSSTAAASTAVKEKESGGTDSTAAAEAAAAVAAGGPLFFPPPPPPASSSSAAAAEEQQETMAMMADSISPVPLRVAPLGMDIIDPDNNLASALAPPAFCERTPTTPSSSRTTMKVTPAFFAPDNAAAAAGNANVVTPVSVPSLLQHRRVGAGMSSFLEHGRAMGNDDDAPVGGACRYYPPRPPFCRSPAASPAPGQACGSGGTMTPSAEMTATPETRAERRGTKSWTQRTSSSSSSPGGGGPPCENWPTNSSDKRRRVSAEACLLPGGEEEESSGSAHDSSGCRNNTEALAYPSSRSLSSGSPAGMMQQQQQQWSSSPNRSSSSSAGSPGMVQPQQQQQQWQQGGQGWHRRVSLRSGDYLPLPPPPPAVAVLPDAPSSAATQACLSSVTSPAWNRQRSEAQDTIKQDPQQLLVTSSSKWRHAADFLSRQGPKEEERRCPSNDGGGVVSSVAAEEVKKPSSAYDGEQFEDAEEDDAARQVFAAVLSPAAAVYCAPEPTPCSSLLGRPNPALPLPEAACSKVAAPLDRTQPEERPGEALVDATAAAAAGSGEEVPGPAAAGRGKQDSPDDVIEFEGHKFHYLDSYHRPSRYIPRGKSLSALRQRLSTSPDFDRRCPRSKSDGFVAATTTAGEKERVDLARPFVVTSQSSGVSLPPAAAAPEVCSVSSHNGGRSESLLALSSSVVEKDVRWGGAEDDDEKTIIASSSIVEEMFDPPSMDGRHDDNNKEASSSSAAPTTSADIRTGMPATGTASAGDVPIEVIDTDSLTDDDVLSLFRKGTVIGGGNGGGNGEVEVDVEEDRILESLGLSLEMKDMLDLQCDDPETYDRRLGTMLEEIICSE